MNTMIAVTQNEENTLIHTLPEVDNGWETTQSEFYGITETHVLPCDDLKPHLEHHSCWCHPEEDPRHIDIYWHKALDNREWYFDNPYH